MIHTLIVDDEYLALNLLEGFIGQVSDLKMVGKEKSPLKALEILSTEKVDLLFLDIQMPSLSGNNLLKTLKHPPLTIFTTAYSDFAVEAFSLNAVDYLLKPFSFERFLQAVNKARDAYNRDAVKEIAVSMPSETERTFFTVKADGKMYKIFHDEILFVEGLKEYVRIVCEKDRYVIFERLKNLEASLPAEAFIRVHKSFIVAKSKVKSLEGQMLEIAGNKIPISRQKKDEVVQQVFFNIYQEPLDLD